MAPYGMVRLVLSICNFLFLVFSVIAIAIGGIVLAKMDELPAMMGLGGSAHSAKSMVQVLAGNQWMLKLAGGSLIAIGILIMFVSTIGFVGFVRHSPSMLYIYSGLLGVLAVTKVGIVAVMLTQSSHLQAYIRVGIVRQMRESYVASLAFMGAKNHTTRENSVTSAVNFIQIQLHCCTVQTAKELDSSQWKEQTFNYSVPASCCPLAINSTSRKSLLSNMDWGRVYKVARPSCYIRQEEKYSEPCAKKIAEAVRSKLTPVLVVAFNLVAVEVFIIVLAILAAQADEEMAGAF